MTTHNYSEGDLFRLTSTKDIWEIKRCVEFIGRTPIYLVQQRGDKRKVVEVNERDLNDTCIKIDSYRVIREL